MGVALWITAIKPGRSAKASGNGNQPWVALHGLSLQQPAPGREFIPSDMRHITLSFEALEPGSRVGYKLPEPKAYTPTRRAV